MRKQATDHSDGLSGHLVHQRLEIESTPKVAVNCNNRNGGTELAALFLVVKILDM